MQVFSFTCVIKACTDHKQYRRALEFVVEMRSLGVESNSYTEGVPNAFYYKDFVQQEYVGI